MQIEVPYGRKLIYVQVEDPIILKNDQPEKINDIKSALDKPIGTLPLHKLVRPQQSVAIITSDITRPCPTHLMLPLVVEELLKAGVGYENIVVVFALGAHRNMTYKEQELVISKDIFRKIKCYNSNAKNVVYLGTTCRGTPVEIFKQIVDVDFRIGLGNVEEHYFAGYSGGLKALVPGVCSHRTISKNHSLMVDPNARAGILEKNPVREDIEEAANMLGLDFILNVVLDRDNKIVAAAAGDSIKAHHWLCNIFNEFSSISIDEPADIILVSAGGYPKDINMYQAQKVLDKAFEFVKVNGIIIWVAECTEGLGNEIFQNWMVNYSAYEILKKIRNNFILGGHKAAAIAKILKKANIWLVSALSTSLVHSCGMIPYSDVKKALTDAYNEIGKDATLFVI